MNILQEAQQSLSFNPENKYYVKELEKFRVDYIVEAIDKRIEY